jgi:hypothetical protein
VYDHLLNGPLESFDLEGLAEDHAGLATAIEAQGSAATAEEALLAMGADPKQSARVGDPEASLPFHALLSTVQNTEVFRSLPTSELRLIAGVILARHVANRVVQRSATDPEN